MKNILALLMLFAATNLTIAQTTVGDATLPNTVTFSETNLQLNGAGMREKMWIDLYAGGLYLTNKSSNASTIIDADEPMAMKLHIVSGLVTQEKMVKAVNEGFEKSSTGKASAAEIKKFKGFFNDEIVDGTILDIVYVNGSTTVYRNGKEKGSVAGLAFKKALFGIWLGNKPADKDLKKGMLGK